MWKVLPGNVTYWHLSSSRQYYEYKVGVASQNSAPDGHIITTSSLKLSDCTHNMDNSTYTLYVNQLSLS